MTNEKPKPPPESPPLPHDYEGVTREKFDWNRVPSWPFLIYTGILFMASAIPGNDFINTGDYFSRFYQGELIEIVYNWSLLILPIIIFLGFITRKRINIFIPISYFTGCTLPLLAISIEIIEKVYNLDVWNTIYAIIILLLIFFPPLFEYQNAIARKYIKLPKLLRYIEGGASIILFLSSILLLLFITSRLSIVVGSIYFIRQCGILAFLIATSFSAFMGLLNCTKYNNSLNIANLRIWGILIAIGCLFFMIVASIIASFIMDKDIEGSIDLFRFILYYSGAILLTAHSGAWLLIRHIETRPKYDIRVTSAAEEDGWDDEKP